MSPLELPGRSFGYLPDRRNVTCDNCGRSARRLLFEQGENEKKEGVFKAKCPYCNYQLEIVAQSKVLFEGTVGEL